MQVTGSSTINSKGLFECTVMLSPTVMRIPTRSAGGIFGDSHLTMLGYMKSRLQVVCFAKELQSETVSLHLSVTGLSVGILIVSFTALGCNRHFSFHA